MIDDKFKLSNLDRSGEAMLRYSNYRPYSNLPPLKGTWVKGPGGRPAYVRRATLDPKGAAMQLILAQAFKLALRFAVDRIKDVTDDRVDVVIDAVFPVFVEMVMQARSNGIGYLSPEFRKPYEDRMHNVLVEMGIGRTL